MSYGNVHNKSTVKSNKDYCSINGEGSIHSNDLETARGLASGLAESLSHGNEIAYEVHAKSKGWMK
jgi:hypothetical protein